MRRPFVKAVGFAAILSNMSKASDLTTRVTLVDIARVAGVSPTTVSKALNGKTDVGVETRQRVFKVAKELSYGNLKAGGANGKANVAILVSDLSGRFVLPIMTGAEDYFGLGAKSMYVANARGDAIRERHHLRALLSQPLGGIIALGNHSSPRPPLTHISGLPVVYAYAPSADLEDISIHVDHEESGRLAADHLAQVGATCVAIIGGDSTAPATIQRTQGAIERLEAHHIAIATSGVLAGEFSERWGRAACRQLLNQSSDIDGIICGNDEIARGVLDVLRDQDIRVPADVLVIGHDNWVALADGARPPLTTIDMNLEMLGREAARLLSDAMAGSPSPGLHKVEGKLVVRETTLLVT